MRKGFTLVELLAVIGILAVLIAILLPVVMKARYSAKVVTCISDKRQWGVVFSMYALSNNRMLPAYHVPGFTGKSPWDVSKRFTDDMLLQGIAPKMWFCPASMVTFNSAGAAGFGDPLKNPDDLKAYFNRGNLTYHVTFMNFWVPRPDNYPTNNWFPSTNGQRNDPNGWPNSQIHKFAATKPILTDLVVGGNPLSVNDPTNYTNGGHRFRKNRLDGVSKLYIDGHVEISRGDEIKARSGPGFTYGSSIYAFY